MLTRRTSCGQNQSSATTNAPTGMLVVREPTEYTPTTHWQPCDVATEKRNIGTVASQPRGDGATALAGTGRNAHQGTTQLSPQDTSSSASNEPTPDQVASGNEALRTTRALPPRALPVLTHRALEGLGDGSVVDVAGLGVGLAGRGLVPLHEDQGRA